jgi:aryl-alcohol dehydrogenase-like predicted oxidoreductase
LHGKRRTMMKLGLGTVEFSAKNGKHALHVSHEEARRILEIAYRASIPLLDTAPQAGDSHEVLGECLNPDHQFKVVAKAPLFSTDFVAGHHADQLEKSLHQTLETLGQPTVYALMMGCDQGLLATQSEKLFNRLKHMKADGLIEKIGVSANDARQIDLLLDRFTPDIVQLPLNVLDQRLLHSGHLAELKKKNIEIHVRDVFLQGVLLDPTHLHPWFWPIRQRLEDYHNYLIQEGLTPLEGALNFVTNISEVDFALVGVQSAQQLEEVVSAVDLGLSASAFSPFCCADLKFIDPSQWNLYE